MFMRLGTPSGLRMTSTGEPSSMKGMSSCGTISRDDALVAVTAGELVALGDLALLGHEHAHELVDAGREVVAVGAARRS